MNRYELTCLMESGGLREGRLLDALDSVARRLHDKKKAFKGAKEAWNQHLARHGVAPQHYRTPEAAKASAVKRLEVKKKKLLANVQTSKLPFVVKQSSKRPRKSKIRRTREIKKVAQKVPGGTAAINTAEKVSGWWGGEPFKRAGKIAGGIVGAGVAGYAGVKAAKALGRFARNRKVLGAPPPPRGPSASIVGGAGAPKGRGGLVYYAKRAKDTIKRNPKGAAGAALAAVGAASGLTYMARRRRDKNR
jgi:hypothetical protein